MSFRYDIDRLKKDELLYELSMRGFKKTDKQTVDDLRSLLRPILKLEKDEKSLDYPKLSLGVSSELSVISSKLAEITGLLEHTSSKGDM